MSRRSVTLTSAPASEPVTLSEVKAYLKVDGSDEDALITSLIATARRACEEFCKRAFITQTWKTILDTFPCEDEWDAPDAFLMARADRHAIQLPRQPLQSVTSIKTTDTVNVQTTVPVETYDVDLEGGRIVLNDGYTWPTEIRASAGIEIISIHGYGDDDEDVPDPIRIAVMQYVGGMYENRTCADMPDGVKTLLMPFLAAEAFGAW